MLLDAPVVDDVTLVEATVVGEPSELYQLPEDICEQGACQEDSDRSLHPVRIYSNSTVYAIMGTIA